MARKKSSNDDSLPAVPFLLAQETLPRVICMHCITPQGNVAKAKKELGCLATKAYCLTVGRELGLRTSYQMEKRFSPPGTFHGAAGRSHWWDTGVRHGRPNVLRWRPKRGYDRIAEVEKVSRIGAQLRLSPLWRLLDPMPLRPDELYGSVLSLGEALRDLASLDAFEAADPFHLDLMVWQCCGLPVALGRLHVAAFGLRRAEAAGDYARYQRAVQNWDDLQTFLRSDCYTSRWQADLERYFDRWFRRVSVLVKYSDESIVCEIVELKSSAIRFHC